MEKKYWNLSLAAVAGAVIFFAVLIVISKASKPAPQPPMPPTPTEDIAHSQEVQVPAEIPAEPIIFEEEPNMENVIKVNGMMCPHCKAMVEKVCKAVPGTTDAVVDLQAKTVTVTGDADVAALKQAIVAAGYEVVE